MSTAFYAIKNNAKTTITNNPLTAGGLSITLASSTGALFPTTGNTWTACIWDDVTYPLNPTADPNMEIVLIDSRSTDTLTVNASGRGFGGTTGVSHATGSAIAITMSKEHISQITTAITTLEARPDVGTYTPWTTWVPTYTANAGTWTSVTGVAQYTQIGKTVFVNIFAVGTTSSTPATLHFTLPITPSQTTDLYIGGGCLVYKAGTSTSGFFFSTYTSDGVIKVKMYDGGAFTASASNGFNINFCYQVA